MGPSLLGPVGGWHAAHAGALWAPLLPPQMTPKIKTTLQYLSIATFGSALWPPRAELLALKKCDEWMDKQQTNIKGTTNKGVFNIDFCLSNKYI